MYYGQSVPQAAERYSKNKTSCNRQITDLFNLELDRLTQLSGT